MIGMKLQYWLKTEGVLKTSNKHVQEGTWSADVEGGRGPCNDHGLPGHVFALPDGRCRTFEYVPKCRVPGCEH